MLNKFLVSSNYSNVYILNYQNISPAAHSSQTFILYCSFCQFASPLYIIFSWSLGLGHAIFSPRIIWLLDLPVFFFSVWVVPSHVVKTKLILFNLMSCLQLSAVFRLGRPRDSVHPCRSNLDGTLQLCFVFPPPHWENKMLTELASCPQATKNTDSRTHYCTSASLR